MNFLDHFRSGFLIFRLWPFYYKSKQYYTLEYWSIQGDARTIRIQSILFCILAHLILFCIYGNMCIQIVWTCVTINKANKLQWMTVWLVLLENQCCSHTKQFRYNLLTTLLCVRATVHISNTFIRKQNVNHFKYMHFNDWFMLEW